MDRRALIFEMTLDAEGLRTSTRLMRARFFFEDVGASQLDDPEFLAAAFERWAAHVHR